MEGDNGLPADREVAGADDTVVGVGEEGNCCSHSNDYMGDFGAMVQVEANFQQFLVFLDSWAFPWTSLDGTDAASAESWDDC